ncbi:MAG: heavy-metal-associated domain-containing protein [Pirellulales bacterium]
MITTIQAGICNADESTSVKHQVTGLFSKERIDDLKMVFRTKVPEIKLSQINYDTAEITVEYDSTQALPNISAEEALKRLDQLVRTASNNTFGVKPLCATPREKLKLIKIPVAGLDCKACALAAYESVYRVEGVEQATVSFKKGLVTAWIQPHKISRLNLEEALRKKGVKLLTPMKQEE